MTLILTAATPGFVVQASDRLLTKAIAGRPQIYDPIANKTMIYRAKDAIAAVSYSGRAFYGRQPTDEWIAEKLWGKSFPRSRNLDRPATVGFESRSDDWTINTAVAALKQSIDSLPQRWINGGGLFIVLAGWREDRGSMRPFLIEIERPQLVPETKVSGAPRRWPKRGFVLGRVGANVPMAELRSAFDRFRPNNRLAMTDVEETFVEIIRTVAHREPTVGPHVLTVLLPPPTEPAHCRFHPATQHWVNLMSSEGKFEFEVAHGPWVLGIGQFHAPAGIVGDSVVMLDDIPVVFHGPPGKNGLIGLQSAISRPPP